MKNKSLYEKFNKDKTIQLVIDINFWFFLILFLYHSFFFILHQVFPKKEGFVWSPSVQDDFLRFQSTVNPRYAFDVKEIQNQASEEEVRELLRTGLWPWNDDVKQTFVENVQHNRNIKVNPWTAMQNARSRYNQSIAMWILKKKQFLDDKPDVDVMMYSF